MFGAMTSKKNHSYAFVSKAAADGGIKDKFGLEKSVDGVVNCRNLTKKDMMYNDTTPRMEVNPETFEVKADGEVLTCEPLEKVPLAQKYFLF
jgi:urease subunit alpha